MTLTKPTTPISNIMYKTCPSSHRLKNMLHVKVANFNKKIKYSKNTYHANGDKVKHTRYFFLENMVHNL